MGLTIKDFILLLLIFASVFASGLVGALVYNLTKSEIISGGVIIGFIFLAITFAFILFEN